MSNVENNLNSEKNMEKTEALFEAFQNVPEELLERSEKGVGVDRVIVFIKQHKQVCAACVALAFAGLCFIGYQSVNGGADNAASYTGGVQEMQAENMCDDGLKQEEDLENVIAGSSDAKGGKDAVEKEEQLQEPNPETYLEKDVVEDVVQEAVNGMEGTKDLYAAYMPKEVPTAYEFDSVNMSKGEKEEVLQIRLVQPEGQYIQLIVKRTLVTEEPNSETNNQQTKENVILAAELSTEAIEGMRTLNAESEKVSTFTVQYGDGVSIECEGTASAEDIYKVLASCGKEIIKE